MAIVNDLAASTQKSLSSNGTKSPVTESKASVALTRSTTSKALLDSTSPLLLGHRGSRAESVENMPAALIYACTLQRRGLAGIEFDVQLSADGQLLIFHDDTLVRLGNRQARLDQLTLAEIRRIRIFNEPILALNDLLTYPLALPAQPSSTLYHAMMDFAHIELEIKTHERTSYKMLIKALEDSLINKGIAKLPIVLTSFDTTLLNLLHCHPILSKLPRGLLCETPQDIAQLSHTAQRLSCRQVGVHYPLINTTVINQCHAAQLSISAWTVNERVDAANLSDLGVDVLITDYPAAFLKFM